MAATIANYQPSTVLQQAMTVLGPPVGISGISIGMFHTYAFSTDLGDQRAPSAQGQLLNISQHADLFAIFGTTYGGDGITTFALPDLSGRSAIGEGQGPGLALFELGEASGTANVLVQPSQMPVGSGGSATPLTEDSPQLAVTHVMRVEGFYPSIGSSSDLELIATVWKFAGNDIPDGHLECNGQTLLIADYIELFSLIGTTYGGDGMTNFALPDMRGRTVVGTGAGHALGDQFGDDGVVLTLANMPVEMGGGGQPVSNVQPSVALNFCIALQGIFPSPDGGASPRDPFIGEIITFAGNFAPGGWAFCNGQLLPINQNQALFSLLGFTYGGNGTTHFALPDLRGMALLGAGSGFAIGDVVGSSALTLDNIPDLNFSGTASSENLYGGNGSDTINGLDGADTIRGHGGADTLNGGSGNDLLIGGAGGDALNGGGGTGDTADYMQSLAGVTVGINAGGTALGGDAAGDTLSAIENLAGSDLGDTLTGNTAINVLTGNGGNDSINASNNNDFLYGGNGDDLLAGGVGADLIDGGANHAAGDTATYANHTGLTGMTINLTTGVATGNGHGAGDTLIAIENVVGSAQNDTITGDGNDNVLTGGNGNDTLIGGGGADTLNGQNGDDIFIGGAGADINNGGSGLRDKVDYSASMIGVSADLRPGGVGFGGDAIGDTWSGIEDVTGSAHDDTLSGSTAANILLGGLGDDILDGSSGADTMNGGGGTADWVDYSLSNAGVSVDIFAGTASGGHAAGDTLFGIENLFGSNFNDVLTGNNLVNTLVGGDGNDTLTGNGNGDTLRGSAGDDTMNGGNGADNFLYFEFNFGQDGINGWQDGYDKLDFTAIGLFHADFAETQVGADTLLTLISDPTQTVRITNTLAATIDAGDFL